jgi:hypothetical protein
MLKIFILGRSIVLNPVSNPDDLQKRAGVETPAKWVKRSKKGDWLSWT